MAKKLALTIAGAVSLGSYEAGVMYEVLDALGQHNTWAVENGKPEQRIEIDVLTGASAGGMTAAMTAISLLFDGASLSDPYGNPMYDAWVKEVDITKLLARGKDENASYSLLSSDCVIGISKAHLTPTPPPAGAPHPALAASGKISLGLAISNLNGVDYDRPTMTGGKFTYTRHVDQHLFHVDRGTGYVEANWETIRATAVACGAFPVAFRTQELLRDIEDYADPYLDMTLWAGKTVLPFCYTDGGVFYNEPLGMATNLVQELPGGRLDGQSRGYLFIAPKPKASDVQAGITAANSDYKMLAQGLAGAVLGQSEFQDWVMAESFNDKLKLLDTRAAQLQGLYSANTLTAAQTRPVNEALLSAFFTENGALQQAKLDEARAQLKTQYAQEYAEIKDPTQASAWLDSVLVLELAADLHCKEEMYIYDFVADPVKLAGGGLSAFTGFFDQSYRDHDYDYGRSVGQARIAGYAAQAGSVFDGLHWTPKEIRPIDSNLNDVPMSNVDRGKREQVRDQMLQAADDLLAELGLNVFERIGAKDLVIKKRIDKVLAL